MKKIKIFISLFLITLLCSCTQSTYAADIKIIGERINKTFDSEIFKTEDTVLLKEDGENVIYWFPEEYKNVCAAFYPEDETDIIKSSSVTIANYNKKSYKEFLDDFSAAIKENNKYIESEEYQNGNLYTMLFIDKRYKETISDPTLKRKITDDDISFPVLEEESKSKKAE